MYIRDDCPLPPGSSIYAYLRVSGEDQAERGTPIAGQRQELERYIQAHGLVLAHIPFIDEARSGSSTTGRDAFLHMIQAAHNDHRADGVVFWSWARFARDETDAHFYKADLRRHGLTVWSLTDDVPSGEFEYVFEAMIHWKDAQYIQQLSRNIRRGIHLLAQQGYAHGGFPPRGYSPEELEIEVEGKRKRVRRWIPDPELAPRVRKAWEMRSSGSTYREIHEATRLFRGVGCYSSLFSCETYRGLRYCGETRVEGAHEALCTPEQWDAVQKRRKRGGPRPKERRETTRPESSFILTGLLRCGICGGPMVGSTDRPHSRDGNTHGEYRYYICSRKKAQYSACSSSKMSAGVIEAAVIEVLTEQVLDPDHMIALCEKARDRLSETHTDLQSERVRLAKAIMAADTRLNRVLDAIEERGFGGSLQKRLDQREVEAAQLRSELRDLEREIESRTVGVTTEELRGIVEGLRERLRKPQRSSLVRRALGLFVSEITVTREGGVIAYSFPTKSVY